MFTTVCYHLVMLITVCLCTTPLFSFQATEREQELLRPLLLRYQLLKQRLNSRSSSIPVIVRESYPSASRTHNVTKGPSRSSPQRWMVLLILSISRKALQRERALFTEATCMKECILLPRSTHVCTH